jgi:fluoride exporter
MKLLTLIFLGGGLGSIARYGAARWLNVGTSIPLGTLVANVTACFILGVLVGIADQRQLLSGASRAFWAIGFCGGFSTFSTFSQETITLIQSGSAPMAIFYALISLLLCPGAIFLGIYVARCLPLG